MAKQKLGVSDAQPANQGPTAYNVKPVHERLKHFTDDELKQLQILPPGNCLEPGATYIDLNNLRLGEFKATGDMQVSQNVCVMAKKDMPYELWNRLLGSEASRAHVDV